MEVVLSGGAGFAGAHLAAAFLTAGARVTVIDVVHPQDCRRLQALLPADWPSSPRFRYLWGSAGDFHVLPEEATVIHLASVTDVGFARTSPAFTINQIVTATATLLDECVHQGIAHFIYFSSHSVYGGGQPVPCPEDVLLRPSNHYGGAKAAAEAIVLACHRERGLAVTIVRPSLLYGPWERSGSLVSTFLRRAFRRQPITLDGGGTQARSMTYIGDIVAAVLAAAALPGEGDVYNLASGHEVSIRELAILSCQEADIPFHDICTEGPPRAGEEGRLVLDGQKARERLGMPSTRFSVGFAATAAWVRGQIEQEG